MTIAHPQHLPVQLHKESALNACSMLTAVMPPLLLPVTLDKHVLNVPPMLTAKIMKFVDLTTPVENLMKKLPLE